MNEAKQKVSVWFTRNLERNRLSGHIDTDIDYALNIDSYTFRRDSEEVKVVPAPEQITPSVARIIY